MPEQGQPEEQVQKQAHTKHRPEKDRHRSDSLNPDGATSRSTVPPSESVIVMGWETLCPMLSATTMVHVPGLSGRNANLP